MVIEQHTSDNIKSDAMKLRLGDMISSSVPYSKF